MDYNVMKGLILRKKMKEGWCDSILPQYNHFFYMK